MLGLIAAAWAGERAPLPAYEVERPLGVPKGWLLARVDGGSSPVAELRYGILPRLELGLALAPTLDPLDAAVTMRARATVLRTEPPNRSVVVDLQAAPPALPDQPLVGTIAVAAAQQLGPFLIAARLGAEWPLGWLAEGKLLLQAGPLAPFGEVDRETAGAGLELQLSRGLEVHGALDRSWVGGATTNRFGVGAAF